MDIELKEALEASGFKMVEIAPGIWASIPEGPDQDEKIKALSRAEDRNQPSETTPQMHDGDSS